MTPRATVWVASWRVNLIVWMDIGWETVNDDLDSLHPLALALIFFLFSSSLHNALSIIDSPIPTALHVQQWAEQRIIYRYAPTCTFLWPFRIQPQKAAAVLSTIRGLHTENSRNDSTRLIYETSRGPVTGHPPNPLQFWYQHCWRSNHIIHQWTSREKGHCSSSRVGSPQVGKAQIDLKSKFRDQVIIGDAW